MERPERSKIDGDIAAISAGFIGSQVASQPRRPQLLGWSRKWDDGAGDEQDWLVALGYGLMHDGRIPEALDMALQALVRHGPGHLGHLLGRVASAPGVEA